MNATLTLAELVNRGMLAMHEKNQMPVTIRSLASHPIQAAQNDDPVHPRPIATAPTASEETVHILRSAGRLVRLINALPTTPDDPLVLRRHILKSVEVFLKDITSAR